VSRRQKRFVFTVVVLVAATVVARLLGYELGRNTFVRCRHGHLFTTIWIPGISLKSLRLGWARYQFCPVGRHWSIVTPVKGATLSDDERALALAAHDVRIP